jgi:hypothetical protein
LEQQEAFGGSSQHTEEKELKDEKNEQYFEQPSSQSLSLLHEALF